MRIGAHGIRRAAAMMCRAIGWPTRRWSTSLRPRPRRREAAVVHYIQQGAAAFLRAARVRAGRCRRAHAAGRRASTERYVAYMQAMGVRFHTEARILQAFCRASGG